MTIMVASVLGLLLILATGLVVTRRAEPATAPMHVVRVPERGDRWLQTAVLALSGLRDHRIEALTPLVLQVLWRRRPAWTVLVAVLLFPLGLLALLVVRWDQRSIVVSDNGPPATVKFAGVFSTTAVGAINLTIP